MLKPENIFIFLKGFLKFSHPTCGISKNVSSKERVKPWFFVKFNIILKYIFPENLIEFSQAVQKIRQNSKSILPILINFTQLFGFFEIKLLQEN